MIEDVETLSPQLKLLRLGNLDVAKKADVLRLEIRRAKRVASERSNEWPIHGCRRAEGVSKINVVECARTAWRERSNLRRWPKEDRTDRVLPIIKTGSPGAASKSVNG